jgi:broad specificity phosphatase PhoE
MNVILMRHGEAIDNVRELISDKEIYWSLLTDEGIKDVLESINKLPTIIDKVYVSPFPRTIQTANYVYKKYSKTKFIIDNRIREIGYGNYSGKKNNKKLDEIRIKQIEGDYFVRFGEYGENKFDIESRLCSFLKELYENNSKENTIMIVSHGSIISYIKRILNIKTKHIQTGEIEEFKNVDFTFLFKNIEKLSMLKS